MVFPVKTKNMKSNKASPVSLKIILTTVIFFFIFSLEAQNNDGAGFLHKSNTMAQRWELGIENKKGIFILTPYRPVYINPVRLVNNLNDQPQSENPAYILPYKLLYKNYEATFQFSFKTKIIRRIFWGNGDIWLAYSQKAFWQIYTDKLSRPIRDMVYEPELFLNFATKYKISGFNGRMIGLVFNHQSNGYMVPFSRGWNRIILQTGFEKNNWKVTLRPSYKLNLKTDGNPKIADYAGRAEAIVVYNAGKQQFSTVMAHSMMFKYGGKGSVQLNYIFPIVNNFKGMLQLFDGYGETLLDYNHKQATVALGVSFTEW